MIKPVLAVVATMCLSWGIAFAIQTARSSTEPDMRVECHKCNRPQIITPTPYYFCVQCLCVQRPIATTVERHDDSALRMASSTMPPSVSGSE